MGMQRVANFRAVGGIRPGQLFRSGHLGAATRTDQDTLRRLGVRTVIDLRHARDDAGPARVPAGIEVVSLPVPTDHPGWRALHRRDPVAIWRTVGRPGAASALMHDTYRTMALDHAAAFGGVLRTLAQPGRLPAVICCRQGKDRTGWAVVLTLEVLGTDQEAIVADYLASNASVPPIIAGPLVRGAVRPLLRVERSYLEAAHDAVRTRYGDVATYLEEALGVDRTLAAALQGGLA